MNGELMPSILVNREGSPAYMWHVRDNEDIWRWTCGNAYMTPHCAAEEAMRVLNNLKEGSPVQVKMAKHGRRNFTPRTLHVFRDTHWGYAAHLTLDGPLAIEAYTSGYKKTKDELVDSVRPFLDKQFTMDDVKVEFDQDDVPPLSEEKEEKDLELFINDVVYELEIAQNNMLKASHASEHWVHLYNKVSHAVRAFRECQNESDIEGNTEKLEQLAETMLNGLRPKFAQIASMSSQLRIADHTSDKASAWEEVEACLYDACIEMHIFLNKQQRSRRT